MVPNTDGTRRGPLSVCGVAGERRLVGRRLIGVGVRLVVAVERATHELIERVRRDPVLLRRLGDRGALGRAAGRAELRRVRVYCLDVHEGLGFRSGEASSM